MFEAYKVGVTVALTNKVSQGLMLIGRDLARTDVQAKKLQKTLHDIKLLGIGGAILGTAGGAGLHALGKALDAAKEYQQELGRFKAIGLGDAFNKDADKFARGSNVIGASATDLIETMKGLHTAMGDYGMAKQLAPQIAQMKFANQAVFGSHGMDFGERQMQAMEKIIEMRGGFHGPQEFMKQADMMQKVISGTGGLVKPTDYMQFIQTAGVAGRLLTDENFYYTMEPLIQEMHAGRVGTGTMSAYNNLAQGRSTVRAAKEMMKYGLLDPNMVEYNKIGTIKQIRPGALKGMEEFTSNPYGWMQDVLLPALAAKGVTSKNGVDNAFATMFGNRTGSNVFSLMFHQQEKIAKNVEISKHAMDTRELYQLALKTPDGAEKALVAAWQNLKIAMGESLWPVIIPGINKLADGLRSLGRWINAHPVKFDLLVKGFAGLSVAMTMGGALLVATAGFKALGAVLGLGGITGVVGSVAALATSLTLLGGAAAAVYGLIANHKEVADTIDRYAPSIGDGLLAAKNAVGRGADWLSGRNLTPPPRNQSATVTVNTHLDGRVLHSSTNRIYMDAFNKPNSGPSTFDMRQSFPAPAWGN